ncbi:MAG TPA: signal peptidase II [Steroidobacteraceae bacterium]|nr:signal peptidase II [Steroidobacteraceae bacterium]
MTRLAKLGSMLLVIVLVVGVDQATKLVVRAHAGPGTRISYLGDTLRLQYAENRGAFLSLGASLTPTARAAVFTAGAGALLTSVLIYGMLSRSVGRLDSFALGLICGGGVGNLIDRLRHAGLVTDFLNVGIGPVRTGIFNVADMALMAGVALLLIRSMRRGA